MLNNRAIYTEKTQCRDCYKCVRECPVKAIRVKDSSAVVDHELCIFCGKCVHVCPAQAKKVRSDIERAEQLMRSAKRVIVSLAPSYPAYFPWSPEELIAKLKAKGAAEVSETAIGAEFCAQRQKKLCGKKQGMISSACPVVTELVMRYYSEQRDYLSPLMSPMCAHAAWLKEKEECAVLFIGPCIAKKEEADRHSHLVDAALTFDEANEWISQANPSGEEITKAAFYPDRAGKASLYPVDGGMISAMFGEEHTVSGKYVALSGTETIIDSLESLSKREIFPPIFCEYLACPGGCINGTGMTSEYSVIERRSMIVENSKKRQNTFSQLTSPADYIEPYINIHPASQVLSPRDIDEALRKLGKENEKNRKDCGGCGYNTCRDFAAAYIEGKAEVEMCVTEMRRLAQRKAHVLMQTIPLGIVIVNSELAIVECNKRFLELFSEFPEEAVNELTSTVSGLPVERFCKNNTIFSDLSNGQITEGTVVESGNLVLNCQSFTIQDGLYGALFQDITAPAVRRETVIRKTEDVIRKNLESTQKIAGLLGETAAETEIILNSLIDAFNTKQPGEFSGK